MPRYTRKQAIHDCKDLWERISQSGLSKNEFIRMKHPELRHKWCCNCPLCEWVMGGKTLYTPRSMRPDLRCRYFQRICPLVKQYGKPCTELDYDDWNGTYNQEWLDRIKNLK